MAHNPKALQAIVQTAAPAGLDLTFRAMFGGILGYAAGKPFASLSDVGLALKLAGEARTELLAVPGAAPLRYEPDAPASKSYVVVPDPLLDDRESLRSWIARSAAGLTPGPRRSRPRAELRRR